MCTISYMPLDIENKKFIMTDNRDESVNRPAVFPRVYSEYQTALFYPKDKLAGGTWFGVAQNKQLICLMNGAFKPHQRKTSYRKSRGVVVKELLSQNDIKAVVNNYNFEGIEAFFAIVLSWSESLTIFELIWDGKQLFINDIDETKPQIWSAAMTYSKAQKQRRKDRFSELLKTYENQINPEIIWQFHHQKGDEEEGIIIDRGLLKTTSIFQITQDKKLKFRYEDLLKNKMTEGAVDWKKSL